MEGWHLVFERTLGPEFNRYGQTIMLLTSPYALGCTAARRIEMQIVHNGGEAVITVLDTMSYRQILERLTRLMPSPVLALKCKSVLAL